MNKPFTLNRTIFSHQWFDMSLSRAIEAFDSVVLCLRESVEKQ